MTATAAEFALDDPRPLSPITGEPRHRLINYLRDLHEVWSESGTVSRPFASHRCQQCGRVRVAPVVKVRQRGVHAHFDGVMRCALVHECPDCSAVVNAERAQEVEALKRWHTERYGRDGALLLTLTVRHGFGDDLKQLRKGVANAWTRFISGKAWKDGKATWGLVGFARKVEVTHGPSGFHPHVHCMLLFRRPPVSRGRDRYAQFQAWALDRWQAAVRRELGSAFVPDAQHGAVVSGCEDAGYLARMGLEIAAPNTKAAKNGNRTPLDILAAYAETGDCDDAELYRRFVVGMKGARQLTYSVGLRAAAGLTEKTDEEIVAGTPEIEPEITRVAGAEFDYLGQVPGARTTFLELAELQGAIAADGYLKDVVAQVEAIHQERTRQEHEAAWRRAHPGMSDTERMLRAAFDTPNDQEV